jgi:hypothetical protein
MTTAVGTGLSPQACRQARIRRLSRRRHTGPAGEQGVQRTERDVAQLANGTPLHAAKAYTPDRHDGFAQCRSDQRRLRPGAGRPGAIHRHGCEFSQHRVDEGIDIGKCIPQGRRRLGGGEGGTRMLLIQWLLAMAADILCRPPARQPSFSSK